jgi:hypothetical protein
MPHDDFALLQTPARRKGLLLTVLSIPLVVGLTAPAVSLAASESLGVDAFLKSRCLECHVGDDAEAGLDLAALGTNLDDRALFERWERIHDRVEAGEMPPEAAGQPSEGERQAFLSALGDRLSAAHAASRGTVFRRLNRGEYENTLNDLFGTNLSLVDRLPEDGRAEQFDNVGEALGVSSVQLQRYLECITAVLDEASRQAAEPPPVQVVRASYADTRGGEQWLNRIWLHRDDGAVVFFKQYGYPSGMLREANVQRDGWYRVKVTGYAFQSEEPITFSVGATTFARGVRQPTFGFYSLPPGPPTTIELKAWIPARYMIDITPYGIWDEDNKIRQQQGAVGYDGPGLAIQHVEIEGPLVEDSRSRGDRLLFEGLDRREIPPRNPNDRRRSNYVPRYEVVSQDPAVDATEALRRVATRAFRRPVAEDQLGAYVELFRAELQFGATFEEAFRTAVSAIFCSTDFLFLREPPGPLDDYALAARLSYFLTRTTPDDELLELAAAGKLSDPAVLTAQTERLLKDPRSARFVADFTDAWLNLRDIEFTNPDGSLFPEFDPYLQFSMVEEVRTFFRKLIDDNLGAVNLAKSDFAMLNERLAEHYAIDGVHGPELRPVRLYPGSVRGGVLGQAGVLKVSANGTSTSPVVRGVWVLERLLGETPPPPPKGVPGVEPDIRGATTLREQLDKHRTLETCQSCHRMIDPPGFALESFDPIGGWRERYRSIGEGDHVDREVRGSKVRYRLGPAVDPSGETLDGREFRGFVEFREMLAEDEARLAHTLAEKLLTFGTGRLMGFSDRKEIDEIVRTSAADGHGVRSLILAVVGSEIFRHK